MIFLHIKSEYQKGDARSFITATPSRSRADIARSTAATIASRPDDAQEKDRKLAI
jgi:hypothetical protein